MNLAIVGSRNFNDYDLLEKTILDLYDVRKIKYIVSGGAYGADKLAEDFSEKYKIDTKIYIPEWDIYGKKAGYLRNVKIIENCDEVIAFWDNESPGTKITIDLAKKKGKYVVVVNFQN